MIAKKNKKADLERKRFAFFQIGLIVAGSLCLAAFEYTTVSEETGEKYVFEPTETIIEIIPEPFERPKEPKSAPKVVKLEEDVNVVKEPVVTAPVVTQKKVSKIVITEDPGLEIGEPTTEPFVEPIVLVPDFEPEFPGGASAMASYINDNIDLPSYIAEYDQGTMYVQFVVNKDGSIEQVDVVRGLSNELNRAAEKVVKKMPKWKPGEQAGKPVRVRFTLPINIQFN